MIFNRKLLLRARFECHDVKMILSPECFKCPAAKLLVVQWRSQTTDRILEEVELPKRDLRMNLKNDDCKIILFTPSYPSHYL